MIQKYIAYFSDVDGINFNDHTKYHQMIIQKYLLEKLQMPIFLKNCI